MQFKQKLIFRGFYLYQMLDRIYFKNLALSITRYHGQLSSCKTSEKTNDPILRKLSDARTARRTDGRITGPDRTRVTSQDPVRLTFSIEKMTINETLSIQVKTECRLT